MDFTLDATRYLSVAVNTDVTRFCTLAAVLTLFWDWVTHFDDEVEYIWKRDWRMAGKPLYLDPGARNCDCAVYYVLLPIGTPAFLFVVDVVLAYRTLCLYRLNRRLVMINISFFCLAVASTAAIVGYSFSKFGVVATPRFITGCWATMPPTVYMTTVPLLVFELWLFSLVVFKLIRYTREVGRLSRESILQLLVKDSMSWFFIIAAMILWNGLNFALAPEGLRGIALPLFRTCIVIGGCRLVIHMRQQMYKTARTYDTIATAIEFGTDRTSHNRTSYSSNLRHKQRVLRVAQQIGLPPASGRLASMWPDAQADVEQGMPVELDSMPGDELGIVEHRWRPARSYASGSSLTQRDVELKEYGLSSSRADLDEHSDDPRDRSPRADPPGLPEPTYRP
ncbi:hypothetical protein FS837_006756 [Tulasnella sp. UAMH 9824]|nr:hypothetical protein FS837_006756 [Tulasnella sp. UAMH 9824]